MIDPQEVIDYAYGLATTLGKSDEAMANSITPEQHEDIIADLCGQFQFTVPSDYTWLTTVIEDGYHHGKNDVEGAQRRVKIKHDIRRKGSACRKGLHKYQPIESVRWCSVCGSIMIGDQTKTPELTI